MPLQGIEGALAWVTISISTGDSPVNYSLSHPRTRHGGSRGLGEGARLCLLRSFLRGKGPTLSAWALRTKSGWVNMVQPLEFLLLPSCTVSVWCGSLGETAGRQCIPAKGGFYCRERPTWEIGASRKCTFSASRIFERLSHRWRSWTTSAAIAWPKACSVFQGDWLACKIWQYLLAFFETSEVFGVPKCNC